VFVLTAVGLPPCSRRLNRSEWYAAPPLRGIPPPPFVANTFRRDGARRQRFLGPPTIVREIWFGRGRHVTLIRCS